MAVPNIFANATGSIPLAQLDTNFATPITIGDTAIPLGNVANSVSNLTLTGGYLDGTQYLGDANLDGIKLGVGTVSYAGYRANIYWGEASLASNTAGLFNIAFGQSTLQSSLGNYNTGLGFFSLISNTTGEGNVGVGVEALYSSTTASYNIGIGRGAGTNVTTGSANIIIGTQNTTSTNLPVFDVTTQSSRIVMGHTAVTNAYVKVAWTVTSDARDKTNFANVPYGLDFVSKLEPISYQFKTSRENETPIGNVRYGFKAQDILELEGDNPVIIDNEDLESLKFNSDSLIPVLVNAIKELKAELDLLKSKVES